MLIYLVGAAKVMAHLMFGIVALTAVQLFFREVIAVKERGLPATERNAGRDRRLT